MWLAWFHPNYPHLQSFMAYQVLARKWRPHNFSELVGQSHVVASLTNALQHQRLHHAYLFTGTRGVGKTTVARILAKAINCEFLQNFNPCGTCDSCLAIDEGRYLDLIEVDAASRTKVEDTRDLLDNVQYAPNRGRYKVYLIDEVHMLSGHSFNALLKTLEEPPEHVKFLLATTDPHKIPVTVLSRCLQFNLKRLSPAQIADQLAYILQQEQLNFEPQALKMLARAADGSMRDALSLLDQAIIFGNAYVGHAEVSAMLGTVAQQPVEDILQALAEQDAAKLLRVITDIAEISPDFSAILQQILQALHRVALYQLNQLAIDAELDHLVIAALAKQLPPEDVQLYYQIALLGQRELDLAPDPQTGFEMVMLRMFIFRPAIYEGSAKTPTIIKRPETTNPKPLQPVVTAVKADIAPKQALASTLVTADNEVSYTAEKSAVPTLATTQAEVAHTRTISNDWLDMIRQMKIDGLTRQLAQHCVLDAINDQTCELSLDPAYQQLRGGVPENKLQLALQTLTGKSLKLVVKIAKNELQTPAFAEAKAKEARQQAAVDSINNDENIQALKEHFGARIMPGTIEPL